MNAHKLAPAWKAALIVTASWLFSASAWAAEAATLVLEHLTTSDGLPQATVMTTLQDAQGFVWLGTEDGLVRYDGSQLVRYAHDRDNRGSLSGNFIWQAAQDAQGDLWIAVKLGGLAHWHRASNTFTIYRHDPADPASLVNDNVRSVLVDARGQVWVGTLGDGVDILDPATGHFRHLRHAVDDLQSLSNDQVFSLTAGASGYIWIGTQSGLNRWDSRSQRLTRFGPARGQAGSLLDQQVYQVVEARNGEIWAGTYENGLVRLDRDGALLGRYRHDAQQESSLASDKVRALLEDSAGRLWIGTEAGLDLLDRASGHFTHYQHDPNDADSLRDSAIMSLYQDQGGLLWIGTRSGGVSRWNPRSWELGGDRPAWLGSEPVMAFADAADGRVWIASIGAGLVRFDPQTRAMQTIEAIVGRRKPLGNSPVTALLLDHLGTLWIGTMGDGLHALRPDGRIDSFAVAPGNPRATSAGGIMSLLEARNGQIWIGTFGGGVNILDPATATIRQLPYGASGVSAADITALAEDADGHLWIGTDGGGLNLLDNDGTLLAVYRQDASDPQSLPSNAIYALGIDARNQLWIGGAGSGLVRLAGSASKPDKVRFERFSQAQGLSSDTLYGVVPDKAGNLWLSSNAGLMRFNLQTHTVRSYHREHGLQGEEFAFGAHQRLRDGRLCFGGLGGFNIFDPAQLTQSQRPPPLALTNIDVLGQRMASPKPFWLLDAVALDYRDSIVSLDFGVLDYGSPQHNRLAYRLPGLTEQWMELGAQRRITLTNLDAGNHLLEVRAATSDSAWSEQPLRISIHRAAAPWKSPWAYALYAALALALILHRVHRQRRKLREMMLAQERLENEVQLRTQELVESNRQLEEAARAKSDFLDRMSHELRTPMNGVVGMTELLSRTALSVNQTHLTKTIRSSAQVLLQIVNDLLDLSKIRAGKVTLEALPLDLGQVLEECTSLLAGAAGQKGIELVVCPPATQPALFGDPLRLRQIVMNLVGNAVKFTSQGEVVVRADVGAIIAGQAEVRIAVSDTGIGMDAAAMNRIFEPFAQADETTTRKFGGTGLGLAICRELSDIMGGRITVESQPQIGSTFHLSLTLKAQPAAAVEPTQLQGRIRILTRRPSLQESLSRHATALGMTLVEDDTDTWRLLDAGTQRVELQALLCQQPVPSSLIVLATPAEVETLDLRVLMDERRIVLKPVHRATLREALHSAQGLGPTTASAAAATTLRGHVLVVEDDPVNATVAEGYLTALGCTSVWVASGSAAVARCAVERFDLVLMDLNMPDMHGFDATALLRKQEAGGRRMPVVALTAHDAVGYRNRCLQADMDDILSKPCTFEECARVLQRWMTTPVTAAAPAEPAAAPDHEGDAGLTAISSSAVAALRKLRTDKHVDLYTKLVDLFRNSSTQALAQLRDAVSANDLRAAAAVCHKLSSSAANVGAMIYAAQVKELERLCNSNEATTVHELHERLQAAHASLLTALDTVVLGKAA